jgi:hypothetical protein
MTIKVGTMIYHESRYWKTDNLSGDEVPGWNARYLPYVVTRITDARIYATGAGADLKTSHVQFPRRPKHRPGHAKPTTLEADGRQYHSRFHEYFYVEIPTKKPREAPRPMSKCAHALLLLGISPPYCAEDVSRAYKRLAREKHPDAGGSHEDFIRLKEARDVALRGY